MKRLPLAQIMLASVGALTLWGAFFVPAASASVVATQFDSSNSETINDTGARMEVLTGLTGYANEFSLMMSGSGWTDFPSAQIWICNGDGTAHAVTDCSNNAASSSRVRYNNLAGSYVLSGTKTEYTFDFPRTAITDKMLVLYGGGPGFAQSVTYYGTTGSYLFGQCFRIVSGTYSPCGTLTSLYFYLGDVNFGDEPSISNISPADHMTTPSTAVTFLFNYHNPTGSQYSQWYVNITDIGITALVVAAPTTTTQQLVGVASAGDNSVSRTENLQLGHVYNFNVQLCGPLTTPNPCITSQTQTFAVVYGSAFANQFYGYNVASSTASSAAAYSAFSNFGSSTNALVDTGLDAFATCGVMGTLFTLGICPILVFLFAPNSTSFEGFQRVEAAVQTKVPFAYFFEVMNDFNNYTNYNDTGQSTTTIINFTNMTCSGQWNGSGAPTCDPNLKQWLPGTADLFDKNAMLNFLPQSWVDYVRSAATIAMGFAFGMYWFNRIRNFWAGARNIQTL